MDWVRVKRYNPSEPILCPGLIILFQLALGLGCFLTYGKDPYLYYIRANVSHLLLVATTLDCCKKMEKTKKVGLLFLCWVVYQIKFSFWDVQILKVGFDAFCMKVEILILESS